MYNDHVTVSYGNLYELNFERIWWRLFQKCAVHTKFDIHVFIWHILSNFWSLNELNFDTYFNFMIDIVYSEWIDINSVITLFFRHLQDQMLQGRETWSCFHVQEKSNQYIISGIRSTQCLPKCLFFTNIYQHEIVKFA